MKMQELMIRRREGTGKSVVRKLRRAGVVPAILYGGAKPQTITVDPRAVLRIIHGHEGSTQLLTLKFDGDSASLSINRRRASTDTASIAWATQRDAVDSCTP